MWAEGRQLSIPEILAELSRITLDLGASDLVGNLAGLTTREIEVLRLVAEGKSDREIGETLFVSRRTAANHVANVLHKLDVSSRAAAAAWAVRNGFG